MVCPTDDGIKLTRVELQESVARCAIGRLSTDPITRPATHTSSCARTRERGDRRRSRRADQRTGRRSQWEHEGGASSFERCFEFIVNISVDSSTKKTLSIIVPIHAFASSLPSFKDSVKLSKASCGSARQP